jgi:hypothetical protein
MEYELSKWWYPPMASPQDLLESPPCHSHYTEIPPRDDHDISMQMWIAITTFAQAHLK